MNITENITTLYGNLTGFFKSRFSNLVSKWGLNFSQNKEIHACSFCGLSLEDQKNLTYKMRVLSPAAAFLHTFHT